MNQQRLAFYSSIERQNKKSSENIHRYFWPPRYSRFQTMNCNSTEYLLSVRHLCTMILVLWPQQIQWHNHLCWPKNGFSKAFCKMSQDFFICSLFIFKTKQDFSKEFGSSQDSFAIRVVNLKGLDPKSEAWDRVMECKLLFWQHKELEHISNLALSIWKLCWKTSFL